MIDLHVTMLPTDELVPYAGNAKEHPEEQIEQIMASIEEFGFDDPVSVWHDSEGKPIIVEGHGRVLAAQRLGIAELPTIALDHLTDAQRRAYVHVHNQTTLTSGFDIEVLTAELEALPEFDWSSYGFDMDELLEQVPDMDEEEDVPTPDEAEPRTQTGQLWQLGRHRLLCGDSTDPAQVERLMGGAAGRPAAHRPALQRGLRPAQRQLRVGRQEGQAQTRPQDHRERQLL